MRDYSGPEHFVESFSPISLHADLPGIPERLLLAHARGRVLFLCGAGVSRSSGLPNFKGRVLDVYRTLDPVIYRILSSESCEAPGPTTAGYSALTDRQAAEIQRYHASEYDVVLGMLERRLDSRTRKDSTVRTRVAKLLRSAREAQNSAIPAPTHVRDAKPDVDKPTVPRPSSLHRSLMRLANRAGPTTIMTTNFDRLLETAAKRLRVRAQTYALGSIPRPSERSEFAGVLHIHGALSPNPTRYSELILTDQDFGEYYLRRRVVPDLIYDAARLFHLVLVGYSANDPPMRYLLDAVAADDARFDDLKERFIFVGSNEATPVQLADWRARGIVPIPYPAPNDDHSALVDTLARWADLSAINGKKRLIDKEIRRIVKTDRAASPPIDQALFDHLFRRGNPSERCRMAELASAAGADPGWLGAMMSIDREPQRRPRR